jgi:hypothetical protein
MSLKIEEQAAQAWAEVRDDKSDVNWVALGYDSSDSLKLIGKGTGGRAELVNHLAEDQMVYAAFRVFGHTGSGLDAKRVKFVGVNWVGSKTKPMLRARGSIHKTHVDKFFTGTHVTISTGSLDDLEEDTVAKKLTSVSGAHKVERYEF